MIALQVRVNNQPLCVAGAEDLSLLNADIMVYGKLGSRSHGTRHGLRKLRADLRVGGMTSRSADYDDSKNEHLDWAKRRLAIGDKVQIRLVNVRISDRPQSLRPAPRIDKARERRLFESAKAYYFANRAKYEKRSKRRRPSK